MNQIDHIISELNTLKDVINELMEKKNDERSTEPNGERSDDRHSRPDLKDEQSNSSINIHSIEASPIQRISPNASSMSFQSNRKTRISSDLLSTQHSQSNTSSSASRFKPPNLFKD